MAKSPPQIIYGAPGVAEKSPEELKELFATLQKHNVKILDTASIYVKPFQKPHLRPPPVI